MRILLSVVMAISFLWSAPSFAQAQASEPIPDAEIFVGDNVPPAVAEARKGTEMSSYTDSGAALTGTYERVLAIWKDPLTLPHTRTRCVKWAKWPGGKTCIGWALDKQWMYVRVVLAVTYPDQTAVQSAVEKCLKQAAIVAALAAVVSGGGAAIPAFEQVLERCVERELGKQVGLTVRKESYWGPWE